MAVTLERLRESLIEQLKSKGADVDCFIDLVDTYMFYTRKERKMQADINKRGLFFTTISSTGKSYVKDNPSIKNAVIYNKQRLAILNQLGLNIDSVESDDEDEL